MSTYTAFHVQSDNVDLVTKAILDWTTEKRKATFAESAKNVTEPWDLIYGDDFIVGDKFPTRFAIGVPTNSYIHIHFNSFHLLDKLCVHLSKTLSTTVIVIHAQTVSDVVTATIYRNGRSVRELGTVDGELFVNEGEPLDFENEVLLDPDAQDEDSDTPFYSLDWYEFSSRFGFQPYEPGSWTIFNDETRDRKRWWQFWK